MATNYQLEVEINYAKAIANMSTFEKHVERETILLNKLTNAIIQNEGGVKKAYQEYKNLSEGLKGADKQILSFAKLKDKLKQ